jgi:hypothetical protein
LTGNPQVHYRTVSGPGTLLNQCRLYETKKYTEPFLESINTEIVVPLRTHSKENTFFENTFCSRRECVLCKIYKRDSGRPATSRAQQILTALEICAKAS